MGAAVQSHHTPATARLRAHTITTTLYELIEAIEEEVGPGNGQLVTETILYLLDTGKIRFSRKVYPA